MPDKDINCKFQNKFARIILRLFFLVFFLIFIFGSTKADEITSPNFKIKGDNISGGSGTGTSSSYGLSADMNPFSDLSASSNFREQVGYNPRLQANTPYPATLANSQDYYDRLLITIDESNNPSDTLYAVIISDDNFATFGYVQNDGTVGSTLGTEDYRSYVSWGGGSGSYILGLNQDTAYKVRVKALNGDFTETGYSSDSNEVKTTVPYVNLSLSASTLALGVLNINSISQTSSVTVRVNTNAYTGYQVYINDSGNGSLGGLYNGAGHTIISADMTLTPGVEGYGAQANSATASIDTKYDIISNQVGGLELATNPLASNTVAVSDEDTSVQFKAAMAPNTTAGQYTDVVYYTLTPNL
jgi:hypothetical protein